MLRPIYSLLNGELRGTGSKTTLYRKNFQSRLETFATLNDIVMNSLPDHDECLVRVESKGYREFIPVPICDLHDLILDNPFKSFHEIIYKEVSKMYFDIDSKEPI